MENEQNKYSLENPRMAPLKAAFFGLLIVLTLNTAAAGILHLLIFGFDAGNLNSTAAKLLQIANQLWFFLLPGLVLSLYIFGDVTKLIRFKLPKIKELGFFGLGMLFLMPIINNLIVVQNYLLVQASEKVPLIKNILQGLQSLDTMLESSYKNLLTPSNAFDVAIIIVVVSITPAVCEEVFFRGFLQRAFELRFNKFIGALISATIFGMLHLNPFGTIGLIILGMYFGFSVYRSGSIFVGMFLHFVNNFFAVLAFLIPSVGDQQGSGSLQISFVQFIDALKVVILLSIAFGIVIYLINSYYKRRNIYS